MGHMKDKHIELMNQTKTPLQDYSNLSVDEIFIKLQEDYLKLVDESGYPLWVYEQYRDNIMQSHYIETNEKSREIESPSVKISGASNPIWDTIAELNTAELSHLLDYENFKASGKGEDYLAYFGNWEDAYDKYLYDLGYYQQEQDIDYLCRLNGYED